MARKPRIKDNYGTYHIRQRGSGITKLFADPADRKEFLEIVLKTGEKNNFQIMSYCISEPDRYDLIIDANGCDISKVMKEINIRYSIYKKCEGCLFKDRFQSELLSTSITSLDPATITEFSSCNEFLRCMSEMTVVSEMSFESVPGSLEQVYERGRQERLVTVKEAREHVEGQLSALAMDWQKLKKDKALRNQLILQMKACSTLTLREIGEVFGGLSESTVSKLVNSEKNKSKSKWKG